MQTKTIRLASAFQLGRLVEELASINRKKAALNCLGKEEQPIRQESILSKSTDEIELSKESISTLIERNRKTLPPLLTQYLSKLEKSEESGLGNMDYEQLTLLHSAIAGVIEEAMPQGTVWHCLQAGRLAQRATILMITIVDILGEEHLPNDTLLKYLAFRADCPFCEFSSGTHLWVVHQVFQNLLKTPKNPKSAESTFSRLETHVTALPVPETLKKEHERMSMALNRISNDLAFVDIHDMIGDDPEDHFSNIAAFFQRQRGEMEKLVSLIKAYLVAFESFIRNLSEDEFFEFEP